MDPTTQRYFADICEILDNKNPEGIISQELTIPIKDIITPIDSIHTVYRVAKGKMYPVVWIEYSGVMVETIPF